MTNTLRGKTVCITGVLSVTRDQFATLIKDAGGVVVSTITRCTDILIVGADAGDAKLEKARALGVAICDEAKARRTMAGEDNGLYSVKLYGSSDDLVEIEGAVNDELEGGDEDTFARFSNGTYVAIRYTEEGIWRARVIDAGRGKVRKLHGMPDDEGDVSAQAHHDPDAPVYSDVLLIESEEPLELESWGREPLPAPRAGLAKAKAIVATIETTSLGEQWWSDNDQDEKTAILAEIARIVETT